jgi:hypothetical protein
VFKTRAKQDVSSMEKINSEAKAVSDQLLDFRQCSNKSTIVFRHLKSKRFLRYLGDKPAVF